MFIAKTKQEIINFISEVRSQGKTPKIAFVPTMGALHAGHLSLIKLAKQKADIVVASVFVNPTQFGPNEDYLRYPRPEAEDIKMLEKANCDAVYMPDVEDIYGSEVKAETKELRNADILCGKFRPGHFQGVITVVGKLFDIIRPDVAVFGEKDFQQLWLIRDNFKGINIIGAPIVREPDGLAMSSRNKYLNAHDRKVAGRLSKMLREIAAKIDKKNIENVTEEAKKELYAAGFTKIDYIEAREEDSLELTKKPGRHTRIFAALWIGNTRLIDNVKLF